MRICPSCGNRTFGNAPPIRSAPPKPTQWQAPGRNIYVSVAPSASGMVRSMAPPGYWQRLVAYLIDFLILTVGPAIAIGILKVPFLIGGFRADGVWFATMTILLFFTIPLAYETFFVGSKMQATPGKLITRLIVVTNYGGRLSQWHAFLRFLAKVFVPFVGIFLVALGVIGIVGIDKPSYGATFTVVLAGWLLLVLGPYMSVFFTPDRLTVFDMICKTRVVSKP